MWLRWSNDKRGRYVNKNASLSLNIDQSANDLKEVHNKESTPQRSSVNVVVCVAVVVTVKVCKGWVPSRQVVVHEGLKIASTWDVNV